MDPWYFEIQNFWHVILQSLNCWFGRRRSHRLWLIHDAERLGSQLVGGLPMFTEHIFRLRWPMYTCPATPLSKGPYHSAIHGGWSSFLFCLKTSFCSFRRIKIKENVLFWKKSVEEVVYCQPIMSAGKGSVNMLRNRTGKPGALLATLMKFALQFHEPSLDEMISCFPAWKQGARSAKGHCCIQSKWNDVNGRQWV